jgi:hypothetical protein
MATSLGVVSWELRVEFCTGGSEDSTWQREAEVSLLLEAAAKGRLMKSQQAGKCFAVAVVICELWGLAMAM